jgi:hypothetical protein
MERIRALETQIAATQKEIAEDTERISRRVAQLEHNASSVSKLNDMWWVQRQHAPSPRVSARW